MKKMNFKTLLLVILMPLIFNSFICDAQEHGRKVIGEIQNDKPVITLQRKILNGNWESALRVGGVEFNISEVEIVQNHDGSYLLMCSNSDHTIAACIALVLINNEFFEQLTDTGGGLTVSCSGCALGCHPVIRDKKGYCEPLCGQCSKTETLTSGAIL